MRGEGPQCIGVGRGKDAQVVAFGRGCPLVAEKDLVVRPGSAEDVHDPAVKELIGGGSKVDKVAAVPHREAARRGRQYLDVDDVAAAAAAPTEGGQRAGQEVDDGRTRPLESRKTKEI